jgi:hypothetical protein
VAAKVAGMGVAVMVEKVAAVKVEAQEEVEE